MHTIVKINDYENISQINDIVHDCWFSVDTIKHDAHKRLLSIRFLKEDFAKKKIVKRLLFFKKYELPLVEFFLMIHNVTYYTLDDSEKVGEYDFNKITYTPTNNEIMIMTGIPLKLLLNVSEFEISIESSGSTVFSKNRWNLN